MKYSGFINGFQFCLVGMVLVLQGCGTRAGVEHWKLTEERAPESAQKAPGAVVQPVSVVFFREAGSGTSAGHPVNVYINGQYHASLVGSNFSEKILCPGQHSLMAAMDDEWRRYATKQERSNFIVGADPMQYFKISNDSKGQVSIAPMTPEAAMAASPSLRSRQAHTVTRVSKDGCLKS